MIFFREKGEFIEGGGLGGRKACVEKDMKENSVL